ncbi:Ig-like domain repeat protein [Isoptericola jiangsuensis]|uniref:Ig-like domain repeat protein n=1 Tax=Isoptericola jiangsuensis TaxID=548579 RepID=UPI003AAEF6F8
MTSGFTALTRTVAMAVATALGLLTLLVAPASAADGDDPVETTLQVVQVGTWRPGGPLVLDISATGPDGEPVGRGGLQAAVDRAGVVGGREFTGESSTVRWDVPTPPVSAGPHEVAITYRGPREYATQRWVGTLHVEEGSGSGASMSVDHPERVEYSETAVFSVDVTTPSDLPVDGRDQPNGQVRITWDDPAMGAQTARLIEGSARARVPAAAAGVHTYEVTYYSSGDLRTSTVSGTFTVDKARLPLSVWSNDVQQGVMNTAGGTWEVAAYLDSSWRIDGRMSLYDGDRRLATRDVTSTASRAVVFSLAPDAVPAGRQRLTVRLTDSPYVADTSASLDLEVVKNPASIRVERATARTLQWGRPHRLRVDVRSAEQYWPDQTPTGTVRVYRGTTRVGTATLDRSGDVVVLIKGRKLPVGRTKLRFVYSGDTVYEARTTYRTVTVHKATTKVRAEILDKTVHRPQRVKVRFHLRSPSDVALTGKVDLKVDGRTVKTVRLKKKHDGSRTVSLPRSVGPTHHYLKVVYRATSTKKKSVKVPLYFRVF